MHMHYMVHLLMIGSADAGKIAAGILVPFFIILGGVIAGAVIYYYWKKSKKENV